MPQTASPEINDPAMIIYNGLIRSASPTASMAAIALLGIDAVGGVIGIVALVVLVVFVFTLVEALAYIWKKGALEWR